MKDWLEIECPACEGQGFYLDRDCHRCGGKGKLLRTHKGQFAKGKPTGYRHPPGLRASPATEFKPGHEPWNKRDYGTPTWLARDGWVTTIEEQCPARSRGREYRTRRRTSWARYLWTKTYGPIPKGWIIWVRRQSPDYLPQAEDLELIDRAELMRRNSHG
jgi:hypothetical protein